MLIPLHHGYHGFDLKFTGNSLGGFFFISQHKKIKNKIFFFKKIKIKNIYIFFFNLKKKKHFFEKNLKKIEKILKKKIISFFKKNKK